MKVASSLECQVILLHMPTFDPAIINIPRNPSDDIMIAETTQRYAPCKIFEFFALYWLADVEVLDRQI